MKCLRALSIVVFFFASCLYSFSQTGNAAGNVTISYTLSRISKMASNQYAIWIEDGKGHFVKSLFVTNFTGKRAGWNERPQSLPAWVQAASVKSARQKDIDAVSGATPRNGTYSVVWDLRDSNGVSVPKGKYKYVLEGNIYMDNRVIWSGMISIENGASASSAEVTYIPADASKMGSLITSVAAQFKPAVK